jgi:uncharacterized protein (DUF2236 family)
MSVSPTPPALVSHRINGERLVVLGWGRAILMQLAHPLVAAGVDAHSTFRDTRRARLARLRDTIQAMLGLTFGSDIEAAAVASRINAVHDRVFGTLAEATPSLPAGTRYSAHDADLLLWVHATLLDSLPRAYQLLVGTLSATETDAYCDEAAVGAARLGLAGPAVPRTTADLHRYLDRMYANGTLAASTSARALAREVLEPPLGWLAGPLTTLHHDLSVGTLPPAIRESYGFIWTGRDERRLRRSAALLRRVRSATPDLIARFHSARRRASRP